MICYWDRDLKQIQEEKIYGERALLFIHGPKWYHRLIGLLVTKLPFVSAFYGFLQRRSWTKKKIVQFIEEYHVDSKEFKKSIEQFSSFDDFFVRSLKQSVRPIHPDPQILTMPADGRYQVFPQADHVIVKGQKFSIEKLVGSSSLAEEYRGGSLALIRLAPPDYHRFHFIVDGVPGQPRLIKGYYYSVNPLSMHPAWTENKRMVTEFETDIVGKILYIEVGATNVGTIHQTFLPGQKIKKGQEKGFFSFGGSAMVLLFKKDTIAFDKDLLEATVKGLEVKAKMGQSLAIATQFR